MASQMIAEEDLDFDIWSYENEGRDGDAVQGI